MSGLSTQFERDTGRLGGHLLDRIIASWKVGFATIITVVGVLQEMMESWLMSDKEHTSYTPDLTEHNNSRPAHYPQRSA